MAEPTRVDLNRHPDVPHPRDGHWPCQTVVTADPPLRLVAFLYRLMRNDLPTGVVEEHLIQTIQMGDEGKVDFTNPHLAALAHAHAAFLMGGGLVDA